MTELWLVVLALAAAVGLVRTTRRGGPTRRAARTHHRVLDTLDTITKQAGEHPVRTRESDEARTHVRLVRNGGAGTGGPIRPPPPA